MAYNIGKRRKPMSVVYQIREHYMIVESKIDKDLFEKFYGKLSEIEKESIKFEEYPIKREEI